MAVDFHSHFKTIDVISENDVVYARGIGVEFAKELGFNETDVKRIEIAISEIGTNILKNATAGKIKFGKVRDYGIWGIEIIALDNGDGFTDIEQAFADYNSTKGTLGIGLSGIKRLMDEYEITRTLEFETMVTIRKWLYNETVYPEIKVSVMNRPKIGEIVSGDDYFLKRLPSYYLICLIDALGHGEEAHIVATIAKQTVEVNYYYSLEEIIAKCNQKLHNTRGAAITLLKLNFKTNMIEHLSIGNIETKVYGLPTIVSFKNYNGIVGSTYETGSSTQFPYEECLLFLLYTDGIKNHFTIDAERFRSTPAELSDWILSKYSREYDDATVVVVK